MSVDGEAPTGSKSTSTAALLLLLLLLLLLAVALSLATSAASRAMAEVAGAEGVRMCNGQREPMAARSGRGPLKSGHGEPSKSQSKARPRPMSTGRPLR